MEGGIFLLHPNPIGGGEGEEKKKIEGRGIFFDTECVTFGRVVEADSQLYVT